MSSIAVVAQQQDSVGIFWESRSTYQPELVNELAALYASLRKVLQKGATIPLQTIERSGGRNVEQLLRERSQVFGPTFPRTADLFTCDLNPSICTVRGDVAYWRTRPDDPVTLPNIHFEPITLHRTIKIEPGSLPRLVVQELKGCEAFDQACKSVIRNLNIGPIDVLSARYRGNAVVPVRGYRATIPLKPNLSGSQQEGQDRRAAKPDVPMRAYQKIDEAAIQRVLPVNAAIFSGNTSSVRGGRTESSSNAATPEGDRARLLELINHPLAKNQPVATGSFTTVAVVDRWVSPKHCLYSQGVHVGHQIEPDSALLGSPPTRCGDRASADRVRDHGTHLVGLIAARLDAPSGPGVDPEAYVRTSQIDPDQFNNARYVSDVAKSLREMMRSEVSPRVFNLSFTYPFALEPNGRPSLDSFESFIRDDASNRLVVAAAGSGLAAPIGTSRSCGLRPVCLDSRNIITVTATDLTPRPLCPSLLDGSNRGAGVDLAAPGLNVVSSIVNDHLGVLSGSSQAAPLVTGALSLLLRKNDGIPLLIAKNRLIYTADQCPNLDVLGGRLNVGRALHYEVAEMQLTGRAETLFGRVVPEDVVIRFTDVETRESFNVQLFAMKRLYKTPKGYYRLLYQRTPHPRSAVPSRRGLSRSLCPPARYRFRALEPAPQT